MTSWLFRLLVGLTSQQNEKASGFQNKPLAPFPEPCREWISSWGLLAHQIYFPFSVKTDTTGLGRGLCPPKETAHYLSSWAALCVQIKHAWDIINTSFPFFLDRHPNKAILWWLFRASSGAPPLSLKRSISCDVSLLVTSPCLFHWSVAPVHFPSFLTSLETATNNTVHCCSPWLHGGDGKAKLRVDISHLDFVPWYLSKGKEY